MKEKDKDEKPDNPGHSNDMKGMGYHDLYGVPPDKLLDDNMPDPQDMQGVRDAKG